MEKEQHRLERGDGGPARRAEKRGKEEENKQERNSEGEGDKAKNIKRKQRLKVL